jgi:thiamine-phosphate pyrophosphorylase
VAGYSAHDASEVALMTGRGVDFVTLSPVFETPSKAGILEPCGVGEITRARAKVAGAVVVGLGGIDGTNCRPVIRAGADGIAVMRAIMGSTNPEAAARELRDAVDREIEGRIPFCDSDVRPV